MNNIYLAIDRASNRVLWYGSDLDSVHMACDNLAKKNKNFPEGGYYVVSGPMLGPFMPLDDNELDYAVGT